MMACRFLVGLVLLITVISVLQIAAGCPSSRRSTPASLDGVLLEELPYRKADLVNLPQQSPTRDVSACEVRQPRSGEDVTVPCFAPKKSYTNSVQIVHQNRIIFRSNQPVPKPGLDPSGHIYSFDWKPQSQKTPLAEFINMTIHHVTLRSTGLIECLSVPVHADVNDPRRLRQCYVLVPLITHINDVFDDTPPTRRTIFEGDPFAVPCRIRLPIPDDVFAHIDQYFLWGHKDRIITRSTQASATTMATAEPGRARAPTVLLEHSNSRNYRGSFLQHTFHLRNATEADTGDILCMFRPHEFFEGWLFRKIDLVVLPRKKSI